MSEQKFEVVDDKQLKQVYYPEHQPQVEVIDLDAQQEEAPVENVEPPVEGSEEQAQVADTETEDQPVEVKEEKVMEVLDAPEPTPQDNEVFERVIEVGVEQQPTAGVIEKVQEPEIELPEGVDKLVKFMNETGGTLADYLHLEKGVDGYSDDEALTQYYRQEEGWDAEEIKDYLEDEFGYDEEIDEPRDIHRKTRAKKTALRKAKSHLKERREAYYNELTANRVSIPKVDKEAQERKHQVFQDKTNEVFGDNFKGFDIDLGDDFGKVVYKVGDVAKVKEAHLNPQDALGEFIKDGELDNAYGYHKAMYFAKNGEMIARRMYEQGRADAIADRAKESKKIDLSQNAAPSASTTHKPGQFSRVETNRSPNRLRVKYKP